MCSHCLQSHRVNAVWPEFRNGSECWWVSNTIICVCLHFTWSEIKSTEWSLKKRTMIVHKYKKKNTGPQSKQRIKSGKSAIQSGHSGVPVKGETVNQGLPVTRATYTLYFKDTVFLTCCISATMYFVHPVFLTHYFPLGSFSSPWNLKCTVFLPGLYVLAWETNSAPLKFEPNPGFVEDFAPG